MFLSEAGRPDHSRKAELAEAIQVEKFLDPIFLKLNLVK